MGLRVRQRDTHELHGGVQPTGGSAVPVTTASAPSASAATASAVSAVVADHPPLTRREALARERATAQMTAAPAPAAPVANTATVGSAHSATEAKAPRSRVRTLQVVGQAVVISALVAGTGAFVGLSTPVDLTVDGQAVSTRTFGHTVADALAAEGVQVAAGDEVSPGVDADLSRGIDIVVNTAKDIDLSVDGIASTETTTAHTVAQALADLGIDPAGAEVSPGLDTPLEGGGSTGLTVVTPKTLTVRADGETIPVEATAASVAEVLAHAGVDVADTDFVTAPLSAPVVTGQNIDVMRTATTTEEVEETVKRPVEKKKTDKLLDGKTKVEEKGKDGTRKVVYEVGTVDGTEVSRVEKSEEILEEPVTEVVLVGTGDPNDPDSYEVPPDDGTAMSTDAIKEMLGGPGSPWYKIVQCESEFNPRAVNRQNNKYFGLFQFGVPTWQGVGGSGNPADASPQEQFLRAKILQERYGWSQWECAGMVGVG
ncbi:hypothetical protein GCM10023159_30190 [Brevibacterium yomogidense]